MNRRLQVLLIGSTLLAAWLGMQVVHECGHSLAAWSSGGTVVRVVLAPWTISRTDVSPNPHPLFVVWGGPLLGTILPLVAWGLANRLKWRDAFLLRFFAGFCAIANGVYIGVGSFERIGDAGDMLRHGSPSWTMWLFGAVAVPTGLVLWHRLGAHFGLGSEPRQITPQSAWGMFGVSLFLVVLGIVVGGR